MKTTCWCCGTEIHATTNLIELCAECREVERTFAPAGLELALPMPVALEPTWA